MEKELKRVYITQDDDGHWYAIPYEMKDDFNSELENGIGDGWETFNDKFSQYMTGGDINLIELYARI